jgi:hypothetical protein
VAVATPPLHAAGAQAVVAGGNVHEAVTRPSQAPPQGVPAPAHAGRAPTGAPSTGLQRPTNPGTLQAAHWSPHAALQQTPSTQNPEAHWSATVQGAPSASRDVHLPPGAHQSPVTQSASLPHDARHAVAPQT